MTADKNVPTNAVKRTELSELLGLPRILYVHNGKCLFNSDQFHVAVRKAKYYGCTYIVGELDYLDYSTKDIHDYMLLYNVYEIDIIDDHRNLKIIWRLKL